MSDENENQSNDGYQNNEQSSLQDELQMSASMKFHQFEKQEEYGMLERIYDEGQGEKFNDLIKNPTKIQAIKAFITEDDILPDLIQEETKEKMEEKKTGNFQEIISHTNFKVIDKLPPTGGETYTSANKMIDRFRKTGTSGFGDTYYSKVSANMPEPKLSRPTTTIINLGTKYSSHKGKQSTILDMANEEEKKEDFINNPLEQITKEIDESDQDEYMNKIHKFIRDAFENRDHKMDFVYYLPSDKENYYELRPKEFKSIAKEKTYYTLSSKGLTVYIDKKPKEFIKLAEWINERQRYNVIADISFFKHFKIWRILKMWRKNIFKQKKIHYQNELSSSLLFNNENYNDKLIKHKSYCNTILKSLKIVDMKVGLDSNSFQKFQDQQTELRKKVRKELDKVHHECQSIFENSIKTIFSQVQQKINDIHNEENRSTDDNKKGKGGKNKKKENAVLQQYQEEQYDQKNGDQKGILNEDEIVGFDNFSYKNKMMIKDECKNFVKLAYLFDYVMLDILRRMFLFSMTEVLQKLDDYNEKLIPPMKENVINKKGEYIKAQVQNQNRTVPYFLIQCKLENDKPIEKHDINKVKVKRFFVKSNPDDDFDPCAHIMIDNEEMEYQKLLLEGKNPQDIINSGMAMGMNTDDIEIELINRPHHYFVSYSPDYETLKSKFEAEINETLSELKVKGWRAHPRFSHYLKYMDDWDEKFGEWDTEEPRDLNVEMNLKEDLEFTQKENEISQKLKLAFTKCDNYLKRLNPYLQLHWKQKSIKKEILLDEYLKDADEMFRLMFVFSEKSKKTLERYIPFEEDVGMIKLTLEENLRKELRLAQHNVISFLKEYYPDKLKTRGSEIENWFNEMFKKIDGPITDESSFLQKTKAKEVLDIWYDINERKLNALVSIAQLLRIKGFEKISAEDVKQIENINIKKFELKLKWDSLNENLNRNQEKMYQNLLQSSIPQLLKETSRIEEPLRDTKFITYDPTQDKLLIPAYIGELEDLEKKFEEIESKSNTYNDFLRVLQQPEYNFDKVENVKELLTTLKQLWKALKEFDEDCETWKKKDFKTIDTKAILTKCDEYLIIGKKAEINVSEKGSAIQVLISTVNNFSESMRVIDYLNCENLKESHWVMIQELFPDCQQKLGDKDYQLDFLLAIKAYEQEDHIRKIQLQAINYDRLYNQIKEIIELKKEIILKVNLEKKIIEEFPKLIEAIEICQSNINNVLSSKYAALFKNEKANNPFDLKVEFETCLFLIEKTKMFQKKFKYIENIINSGDMKRKLQDGNFDKIDVDWKKMLTIVTNSNVNKLRSYGDMIIKAIDDLERIQKKIEEQLKIMRNEFERFYFISNDDLLFMLANSKSSDNKSGKDGIEMIKPYLCKLFEDIYDLKLIKNEQGVNKIISSIISISKEELEFQKLKQVKIEDDLESWLKKLESNILDSLKERMLQMYKYYEDIKDPSKHKVWLEKIELEGKESDGKENKTIVKNLSQVVATVSHIMFVENTENAIKGLSKEQNSLVDWYRKIDQAILSYSQLVNEDNSNNNKNLRRIISNLITHHVHYKDIMAELIEVEPGISDFEWQKQLRTYFVNADPNNKYETNFIAKIRQLKYEFEYGYEYFGPVIRVVITPLTDRVWLTMSSALQIKLGCSLGGPAGTGKTETTKDLAKFFGIQCIVFNCSEQIDYRILGNIFSGLCKHKTGAFACLDEFNRINVEVLSVIATQLFKIRQSMLTGDKMVTIMTDPINLVGKSGVFVTMNPTYTGRTELPDNLKANFRPITMMRPEFSKIAQVKLYSEGFSGSDILSKKLYKLYELAQQQLSQQDHYDFTLRTLGTVLSMAGNLKRKTKSVFGNERKDEDKIVMNALRDANFPKFVVEDIKLFKALLSDLFPDIVCEEERDESFEKQLIEVIYAENLDESPFTIQKCTQLVDIVNIRLGVCLTGPPGTGKTTVINLVEKVCTKIIELNPNCDPKYKNIKKWTINPKSITMGELFGEENEEKKIFEYGIATKKIKKALNDEGEDRYRWVVLDGPIDTKWIENMNSVLDDSQTLCLANGERIKLKSHVKVLFEVEDLSKASLATVSRLGVIYLGPKELGWRPYSHYWMKTFFKDESVFPNELQLYLGQLFEDKVDDAIDNIDDLEKSGCLFIKPVISSLIASLCNLLEFYFTKENGFVGKELPGLDNQEQLGRYKRSVVQCFAMSMVWGMFGCVNNKGSARVESFIRNKFGEIKMENSQVIMEHYYDFSKNDYIQFQVDQSSFVYEKGMPYNSIFVPTIDTMRYSFILNILLGARRNVFVTGETGTGKTAIIKHLIEKLIASEEWTTITMNFSGQTSSEETQRSLESKLDQKKGKKLLWGKGGKKCLIFIDDVNMPEPNEWGAHPPIELLRQYLDKGGLYDRPGFFWKEITNTNMIVSGGPPFGGRSQLTGRFMRHMTTICFPQPGKQVLNNIFESILKGFFTVNIFNENIKKLTIETTSSTIEIYDTILNSMKPIPSKFHYIFNLRDISRVFQGLLMINSKSFNSSESYIKLWIHEVLRVFCDRLNNAEDLKSVQDNIALIVRNKFKMSWTYDSLFKSGPPIYYGEMHKGDVPNRPYEEIVDIEGLIKKLNLFVQIYNKDNKASPLQIVFFDYFIMHIIRVCRVLRQPKGSMVLIGHGGSGKQTVCILSSFIMKSKLMTFNAPRDYRLKDFRNDIKEIIEEAGAKKHSVVVALNDNNVAHNFILEDINNLLNNGEIPNLFENEVHKFDLTYDQFVENTKTNLHVLFTTSPVGQNLRMRVRKFPSLINCCLLNWFMPWPIEALISCCQKKFQTLPYENDEKENLVKLVTASHCEIEQLRDNYFNEFQRKIYITPKSFLDMIDMFTNLLKQKKEESDKKINVLDEGTKKLKKTHEDIIKLEEEIRKLEPIIVEKDASLQKYMIEINEKRVEVEKQKAEVDYVSKQAMAKQKEVKNILAEIDMQKNECLLKFEKIKIQVKEKLSADTLAQFGKEKIINEYKKIIPKVFATFLTGKNTINPDKSYAFQVFEERNKIYKIEEIIEKNTIPDYLFEDLKKDINETIPNGFASYKQDMAHIEDKLLNLSATHQALYIWGKGILDLWEIDKKLRPLKEDAAKNQAEKEQLDAQVKELNRKREAQTKELDHLETEMNKSQIEIDELQEKKKINSARLENASKLLYLLKDEGIRWSEQLTNLKLELKNFLGNIILSSMFISYLQPFSGEYRQKQVVDWIKLCKQYNVNVSRSFSLESVMSDPVEIRQWLMHSLPGDSVSKENAVMIKINKKYPLMIDPQLQANQWLKKMHKGKLSIWKADCKDELMKSQFEGIGYDLIKGNLTLLENVTDQIDSIYYSIISQSFFDDGGGSFMINFNSKKIEFNPEFKMFFTTKLANPHYPPELYIKLNILNFTVTQSGLTEQLLSEVFKNERREKYEQLDTIVAEMGKMNDQLAEFSRDILQKLADVSEDKILDDNDLINTLQDAKTVSDQVNVSMASNTITERETTILKNEYTRIAVRGSILFFVVADMCKIDPMYQFSLEYFKKIFITSIANKDENSPDVKSRVVYLETKVTEDIYRNIKRGIFESHKTIFSLLIDINIKKALNEITDEEWHYFIKGPTTFDTSEMEENPDKNFFSETQWNNLLYIQFKHKHDNIARAVIDNLDKIKELFGNASEFSEFDTLKDGIFANVNQIDKLTSTNFRKLNLIKIFKPEKIQFFIKKLIKEELGDLFVDTNPSRLEEIYEESDWRTPIIFILSKGADPTNEFISFKNRFQKLKKEEYESNQATLLKLQQEQMELSLEQKEENEEKAHEEDEGDQNKKVEEHPNEEKNDEDAEKKDGEEENNEQKDGLQGSTIIEPQQNPGEFQTYIISLGQGQEQEAKKAIREYGIKNGAWVLLQNCHLFGSFMPDLANLVQALQQEDEISGEVNPNFRLWLTSMPVKTFPVSILQNSLKLTTEPPSGIKANMKKLFDDLTEDKLKPALQKEEAQKEKEPVSEEVLNQQRKDTETKRNNFLKILFSLSLFHSVLQERKKFGSIGFNIRYDFNQSDFDTSSQLINIYLNEADADFIPWDSILYLIGEVTYGGSITDETDRTVMNSSLIKFVNENRLTKEKDEKGDDKDTYIEISLGQYAIPTYTNIYEYQKYINTLNSIDDPEIFGLNANANIVYELKESNTLINLLTNILPKTQASGRNINDIVLETINNIVAEEIESIDKKQRHKTHDKLYDNDLQHSLTIVLFQEIDKYNNLILQIELTLKELKRAIEGLSLMSAESDEIFNSLLLNRIPYAWNKIGYSSFKSLSSWISDLRERVKFISDWLINGNPHSYWISGLFYPQGFITGVYQNHARETKIPVSDIIIKFTVINQHKDEVTRGPKSGIYAYGLYLEGASWDEKTGLVDQKPGQMNLSMPVIWFETIKEVVKNEDDEEGNEEEIFIYSCPMFKTGKRASVISSSGHSNEKVIEVDLPSKENKDYWILRGAALIMQLDN